MTFSVIFLLILVPLSNYFVSFSSNFLVFICNFFRDFCLRFFYDFKEAVWRKRNASPSDKPIKFSHKVEKTSLNSKVNNSIFDVINAHCQ